MSSAVPDWTDGVARLVFEVCTSCGRRWYLPRECCPRCASRETSRQVSSGRGVIAAVTTVHTGDEPFAVCLVELDEGVRVMGSCEGSLPPSTAVAVAFPDAVPHFVRLR
jgi:uncharacterized OB-fold protein